MPVHLSVTSGHAVVYGGYENHRRVTLFSNEVFLSVSIHCSFAASHSCSHVKVQNVFLHHLSCNLYLILINPVQVCEVSCDLKNNRPPIEPKIIVIHWASTKALEYWCLDDEKQIFMRLKIQLKFQKVLL